MSDEPLPETLAALLERRGLTLSGLAALLRAEGLTIGRTRLHQLASGTGPQPTPNQLERLASVLGVRPSHFAEYRLWRARSLLDPAVVGFSRAMVNFARLRGQIEGQGGAVAAASTDGGRERPASDRARDEPAPAASPGGTAGVSAARYPDRTRLKEELA